MTSSALSTPLDASTRDTVEAHIAALDVMLDWAEAHELTLTNLHATWFLHGYDEETALPLLLDGAEPESVRKVEGYSVYLIREFGAGVAVHVPLGTKVVQPAHVVTVLNPALSEGGEQAGGRRDA